MIEVILHERALIRGEKRIKLTRREAQVAWILARRWGHRVDRNTIIGHCWEPDYEPEDAGGVIRVMAYRLRKKLAPLGVAVIGNCGCGGFRMEYAVQAGG